MTDHADIVRATLSWCEEGEMGESHRKKGLAALDALVAERDEARKLLHGLTTEADANSAWKALILRAEAAEANSRVWEDHCLEAQAEVARLREALEQIAKPKTDRRWSYADLDAARLNHARIARAALAPKADA